jgi:hypothetical protein
LPTLNDFERDFLKRLSIQPWIAPPTFDHGSVARLVEAGYVNKVILSSWTTDYKITEKGRAAIFDQ